jgi:hypothetical protein
VRVIDPLGLPDDAMIGCVGQMGAPLAMQERMCDGPVIARTVTMMEAHLGRRFDALMLWEIGGNNGFQSILADAADVRGARLHRGHLQGAADGGGGEAGELPAHAILGVADWTHGAGGAGGACGCGGSGGGE